MNVAQGPSWQVSNHVVVMVPEEYEDVVGTTPTRGFPIMHPMMHDGKKGSKRQYLRCHVAFHLPVISQFESTLSCPLSPAGKKGRRKARKTDASDLTPNPQKLHSIGEQLQKLNAAIDGMGPVNDLPAVARARSRKEKNKLASR